MVILTSLLAYEPLQILHLSDSMEVAVNNFIAFAIKLLVERKPLDIRSIIQIREKRAIIQYVRIFYVTKNCSKCFKLYLQEYLFQSFFKSLYLKLNLCLFMEVQ